MIGWLLDTALYTGVLIAAVLVLRRPAARLFGPQLAYALWALPFLRLLLPPIVLPASLAPKASPMVTALATHGTEPKVMMVIVTDAPAPVFDWTAVALLAWLGGALAFLAWRIVTYRWMHQDLLDGARTVGEVGKIRLVETPAVDSPVAFGVRDKVVALPLLFMAQPDRAARDLAITHELEHHRGRDLVANFAAQVLLALHWFNPLAWMAWRAMRRDQEAACDARVLSGRGREDRARYAELIAGTAAGRRLALAAPMACPVLGDASIIHRLRSLAMSDISPRRRRTGRLLVAGCALALPLTASFSYAHAQDDSLPPPPPAPPAVAPLAPPVPPTPEAREERRMQRFALRRNGDGASQRRREIRRFVLNRDGQAPAVAGAWPGAQFQFQGNPVDPEFQKRMQDYARQMDAWSKQYGRQWQEWAKRWDKQWDKQWIQRDGRQVQRFDLVRPGPMPGGVQAPAVPLAPQAPLPPQMPQIPQIRMDPQALQNCRQGGGDSAVTSPDGRRQVVICNRFMGGQRAAESLRRARDRIAGDARLNEETRRQVLDDLDQEIARQGDGDK